MHGQSIHVLLVEDNAGDARLVIELLREGGSADFCFEHVTTVNAGELYLQSGASIDAVLLDLSLPDESGLQTVRRIVSAAGLASVVVMTGADDEELGIAAMQEGAQDYLVKGKVDGERLRRVVRFAIHRQDRLKAESQTDDLTGLHNRRGFLMLAEQQIGVARRNGTGFLLMFLDLDGLKSINDRFGHAAGNQALTDAAGVLQRAFRQSDIVGRLGGDEFAALALGTAGERIVRERLEAELAAANAAADRPHPLGFSVGLVSCGPGDRRSIGDLLAQADAAMYEEKRRRRAGRADDQGPDHRSRSVTTH
jgi:diguanylate cyclase (GGDEF)-like protein